MSKILSKIGKKKRIAGKKNMWGKKEAKQAQPLVFTRNIAMSVILLCALMPSS